MRARVKIDGNDGITSYKAGDELARDGTYIRGLLVNGLAVPLDAEAEAIVASDTARERYHRPELRAVARELERSLREKVTVTAEGVGELNLGDQKKEG